ncbi:hypothetical protein BJ742DRAFT_786448 [Cladochytrium replicatum]|nr:hypothetical protein BJ742DRAFT_786448 [Cladochytrium replicatum]
MSTTSKPINAKVLFNGVLRQFRVDPSSNWESFVAGARNAHGIAAEVPIIASYKDQDGDVISFDTNEEFADVIQQVYSSNLSMIRFELSVQTFENSNGDFVLVSSGNEPSAPVSPGSAIEEPNLTAEGQQTIEVEVSSSRKDSERSEQSPSPAAYRVAFEPTVPLNGEPELVSIDGPKSEVATAEAKEELPKYTPEQKGKFSATDAGEGSSSSSNTKSTEEKPEEDPLKDFVESITPILKQIKQEFESHPEFFSKLEELTGQLQEEASKHFKPILDEIKAEFAATATSYEMPRFTRGYAYGPRRDCHPGFQPHPLAFTPMLFPGAFQHPFASHSFDAPFQRPQGYGCRPRRSPYSGQDRLHEQRIRIKEMGFDIPDGSLDELLREYGTAEKVLNALLG